MKRTWIWLTFVPFISTPSSFQFHLIVKTKSDINISKALQPPLTLAERELIIKVQIQSSLQLALSSPRATFREVLFESRYGFSPIDTTR
jgi:hypothetical protein